MTCSRTLGPWTRQITNYDNQWRYEACSTWIPAIGLDTLRVVLKNLYVSTSSSGVDFISSVAIQVATVDTLSRDGDAGVQPWQVVGTDRTNEGEWVETIDISSLVSGQYFVRIGIAARNESGANVLTAGTVSLTAVIPACGRVISTLTQRLYTNTEGIRYVPVAPWQAAWGLQALVAAVVQNEQVGGASSGNSFEGRLAYVTADTSQDSPSVPALFSGGAWSAGVVRICSTEIDLTGIVDPAEGTKPMWFRPMLAIRVVSGATWGEATVSISLAVRS